MITGALICLALMLAPAAAVADDSAPPPIVAAQIHVLAGEDWQQVGEKLDELKSAGFNAVFFRVFQNRGDRYHALAAEAEEEEAVGLYYPSALAPTVADILPRLLSLCRERNIKFYAWMAARRMDWLDVPLWRDAIYDPAAGTTSPANHYDIFNPDFADYLLGIFEELALAGVDGIVLQDDFVIKTYEGFTEAGIGGFRLQNGADASPQGLFLETFTGTDGRAHVREFAEHYPDWCFYKSERLRTLGSAICARVKRTRVNVELVLNVYYDTVLAPEDALCWLGQDAEALVASPFDRISLMAYHRLLAREENLGVSEAIAATADLVSQSQRLFGERLLVKLQVANWEDGSELELDEMEKLIAALPREVRSWALAPTEDGAWIAKAAAGMLSQRAEESDLEGGRER